MTLNMSPAKTTEQLGNRRKFLRLLANMPMTFIVSYLQEMAPTRLIQHLIYFVALPMHVILTWHAIAKLMTYEHQLVV